MLRRRPGSTRPGPTGGGLPNDQASEWPSPTEVQAYSDRLRRTIDQCLLDPGRLTDRAVMVGAIIGVSVPIFLLAALLLYLFAYKWAVFPNTGYTHFGTSPTQSHRRCRNA